MGRLPAPQELIKEGYQGMVISYQWLTRGDNADLIRNSLEKNLARKTFIILDEVHHASSDLAFGKACESAFPDEVVSHRLMTSGTPFRSDNNKILANWVNYASIEDGFYECLPDFRYTLADALIDGIIPVFSFVTMAGEFTYRRGQAVYEGKTFTNAQNEQELTDALKTAIFPEGDWMRMAIEWAHERMKRDRAKGLPECATYIRVSTIKAAWQVKERIYNLTGEDALVVVSKDDDPNSSYSLGARQDPSEQIEQFAHETGSDARSWIIGVGMLGEGISISRLKYRIHATNNRTVLGFMQDLGRLLRQFPKFNPEPVETLIPAHPYLINLALNAMNEIAHVVQDTEEELFDGNQSNQKGIEVSEETMPNLFEALASSGELSVQIVNGEEISDNYANVAEWAVANKEIWRHWGKTPAHLAQMLQGEPALFNLLHQEYQSSVNKNFNNKKSIYTENIPHGFISEYVNYLPEEKANYARKKVDEKVYDLARLMYSDNDEKEIKKRVKEIHYKAKRKYKLSVNGFVEYEEWEQVY
ncbi:MAG: hypothetical protein AAFY21_09760, partial [Cyanobacteria bacterium J06641_2]